MKFAAGPHVAVMPDARRASGTASPLAAPSRRCFFFVAADIMSLAADPFHARISYVNRMTKGAYPHGLLVREIGLALQRSYSLVGMHLGNARTRGEQR
jgi:hypothetical protein